MMKVNFELQLNNDPATIALLCDLIRSVGGTVEEEASKVAPKEETKKAAPKEEKIAEPKADAKAEKAKKREEIEAAAKAKAEAEQLEIEAAKKAKKADDDDDLGDVQEELDSDLTEEELREALKKAQAEYLSNPENKRSEFAKLVKMAGGVKDEGTISPKAVPAQNIPSLLKALKA